MYNCYRPETLKEALELMNTKVLIPIAGGTDLMIRARNWQGATRAFKGDVILIAHLHELCKIEETESAYILGAGVTQTQCANCEILPTYLREVVGLMATPAIRNAATIGGNIANAASVADLLPVLYATGASVKLQSKNDTRMLNIEAFILDKYKTARRTEELLTEIHIPKLTVKHYMYQKMGQRRASILSKISFIALETKEGTQLAIGALNDSVVRNKQLEIAIVGGVDKERVLEGYKKLFNSKDDKRSTKAYRERVALNLIDKWIDDRNHSLGG